MNGAPQSCRMCKHTMHRRGAVVGRVERPGCRTLEDSDSPIDRELFSNVDVVGAELIRFSLPS
jgi:hypothetical protein